MINLSTEDKEGNKGPYRWLSNNEEPTQTFWGNGQPFGDGNCVANFVKDWTAVSCSDSFYYACMKKRSKLEIVAIVVVCILILKWFTYSSRC